MSFSPKDTRPYVQVGKSGLFVYPVGLGSMQFGWYVTQQDAHNIMDAYVEYGGNFIDTADCYSAWSARVGGFKNNPGGVSEDIIGHWLNTRQEQREHIILATKVRAPMGEQFQDSRSTFRQREGLSRRWIIKACEDSLRRLQTDYIDLYQAHWIDPLIPIEETLSVFNDLVRQGKVRYLGCSNYSAWRLMQALWVADKNQTESFISLQPQYNLTAPIRAQFETELAPLCQHYQIGVIPYSPLAGGLLTGKYQKGGDLPDTVRAKEQHMQDALNNEQNAAIIEGVIDIAQQADMHPSQVAISWLRAKPWVTAPIIGASSVQQLQGLMDRLLEKTLSSEHIKRLDELSDFQRPRTTLEE